MAPHHLPFFITQPNETDVLMVVMGIFLVGAVLWVGTLYWRLHSLPDFGTPLRGIAGSVEKIANAAPDDGSAAESETMSAPTGSPETRHSGAKKAREASDV
jgi:hypothetical protein